MMIWHTVPEVAPAAGEVLHDGGLEAAVVEGAAVILVVARVPSSGDAVHLQSGQGIDMYIPQVRQ